MLRTLEPLPTPPSSLWHSARVYDYVCRGVEGTCLVVAMGFVRGRKSRRGGLSSIGDMAADPEGLVWALWRILYRARRRLGAVYDLFIAPAPRLVEFVAQRLRERLAAWRAGNARQWSRAVELFRTESVEEMVEAFRRDPLDPRWRPFVAKWVAAEKKCARPVTCWFADIDLLGERHGEPVAVDPERAREVVDAVLDTLPLELELAIQSTVPRKWLPAVLEVLEGAGELWRREALAIYSGGGVQLLLPLPRPVDPSHPLYPFIAAALKSAICGACERAGVQVDRFSDPRASYLRAPGSLNVRRRTLVVPIR